MMMIGSLHIQTLKRPHKETFFKNSRPRNAFCSKTPTKAT